MVLIAAATYSVSYSADQAWSDLQQVSPIAAVVVALLVAMVLDLVLPRRAQGPVSAAITVIGLLASLVAALLLIDRGHTAYYQFAVADNFAVFFDVLFAVLGILAVAVSHAYLARRNFLQAEFYVLLLAATAGQMVIAQANSLVSIFLGLELLSIALYVACGYSRVETSSQEAAAKYLEGWRLNPKSPELNHNLAFCLAAQGRFSESIPYYKTALKFRSEYVEAYVNLGNALLAQRKFDDAISSYNEALRSRPNFLPAHFNLANALLQQGKHQQAATRYLETLRLQPDSAQAHNNLALALAGQGKNSEALAHLAEAVRLNPDEAQFHLRFASALLAESRTPEAILEYKEALRLEPAMVAALNDLAWVLATQEDAKLRNASEAVKYAERACDLTGRRQAFLLGTLAAAYAEAGRFPDAVTTAEKAAEVATSAGQKEIATTNQKLAELYRAGKTYRQAPTAQGQGR